MVSTTSAAGMSGHTNGGKSARPNSPAPPRAPKIAIAVPISVAPPRPLHLLDLPPVEDVAVSVSTTATRATMNGARRLAPGRLALFAADELERTLALRRLAVESGVDVPVHTRSSCGCTARKRSRGRWSCGAPKGGRGRGRLGGTVAGRELSIDRCQRVVSGLACEIADPTSVISFPSKGKHEV